MIIMNPAFVPCGIVPCVTHLYCRNNIQLTANGFLRIIACRSYGALEGGKRLFAITILLLTEHLYQFTQ